MVDLRKGDSNHKIVAHRAARFTTCNAAKQLLIRGISGNIKRCCRHSASGDGGASIAFSNNATNAIVGCNLDIVHIEILHLSIINIAKNTKITTSAIDADAFEGLLVAVKVAAERIGAGTDGGVVVFIGSTRITVGKIVHQLEVLAAVVVACIHTGGKEVELFCKINLIGILFRIAGTLFGGPVGGHTADGDHGIGVLHVENMNGVKIASHQCLTINNVCVLAAGIRVAALQSTAQGDGDAFFVIVHRVIGDGGGGSGGHAVRNADGKYRACAVVGCNISSVASYVESHIVHVTVMVVVVGKSVTVLTMSYNGTQMAFAIDIG